MSITISDTAWALEDPLQLCDHVSDLARDGDGQTIGQLFALLGHEHPFVCWQASSALVKLVAEAQKKQQGLWPRVLPRSERVGMQELLAMATDALATDDASHRAAIIEALGQWRHTASLPLLREGLDDPDAAVRAASANALGINQDLESKDRLLDMVLHETLLWVRIAAVDALGSLEQASVAPALCQIVRALDACDDERPHEMGNVSERSMLSAHLINTMGHLAHPQARDLLMAVAQREDETLRWYAARGLHRIGDAAALTVLKPLLVDETLLFDRTVAAVAQEAIDAIHRREQGLGAWLRQAAYSTHKLFARLWQTRFWRRA